MEQQFPSLAYLIQVQSFSLTQAKFFFIFTHATDDINAGAKDTATMLVSRDCQVWHLLPDSPTVQVKLDTARGSPVHIDLSTEHVNMNFLHAAEARKMSREA